MFAPCSAELKVKLEVRYSGVECSRNFVFSVCVRIAFVSNFLEDDIVVGNGGGLLEHVVHGAVFISRQLYRLFEFDWVYIPCHFYRDGDGLKCGWRVGISLAVHIHFEIVYDLFLLV